MKCHLYRAEMDSKAICNLPFPGALQFLFFLMPFFVVSQSINQQFNDSSWNENRVWYGQSKDFRLNIDHQLQSLGNETGISTIYANYTLNALQEWNFWFKMNFAPSESNQLRIYLFADDTSLSLTNAYFIQIGENGSLDALQFYKQIEGKKTLLATGGAGALANEPALARIKITKNNTEWTLSADYTGSTILIEEWTIDDNSIQLDSTGIFAIQCVYTSSRKDKFLFDDIFIAQDTLKDSPPKIKSIISDSNQVTIAFDKKLEIESATDAENYVVSNGLNQPWRVELLNDSSVVLFFAKNLTVGTYEVICKRISDRSGNAVSNLRGVWIHKVNQIIRANDILVTELMIDPSPVVGLPNFEYIELFNNSSKVIDLAPLTLLFENNAYSFDTSSLPFLPGEYLLLCEINAVTALQSYGRVLRMKRWPALRNTNGTIIIQDGGKIINSVSYDDSWYRDSQKKNGGWSLEMINLLNVCDQKNNWIASKAFIGGSPGKVNSVTDLNLNIPPGIDSILVKDDPLIVLYLNKKLNPDFQITIHPNLSFQSRYSDTFSKIEIYPSTSLLSGIVYHFQIIAHDCLGRPLNLIEGDFAKTELATKKDLVLNEILFNPYSGGFDYLEIYNRSSKVISLNNMIISNESNRQRQVIRNTAFILPDSYWVLTDNTDWLNSNYIIVNASHLIGIALPSFADNAGQASLWTSDGSLIDSFSYDESYHDGLLNTKEGVALERINPNSDPVKSNWHSAAGSEGYGTPTRKNSVYLSSTINASSFVLRKVSFTPNNDGIDDLLVLDYKLPGAGFLTQIDIFNDQGRLIRKLLNNVSLGSEGFIEWDGKDEYGTLALNGIYILFIHAVNQKGINIKSKLSTALIQ
ncbi:MAG: lamin tail domain-containing protein [Saprospiraceae bacterium]